MARNLFKSIIGLVICANFIQISYQSQDFCDFWPNRGDYNSEIYRNIYLFAPGYTPEQDVQVPLELFTQYPSFFEQFKNVFNDTMAGYELIWLTDYRQVHRIQLNDFIPTTLGCIFRPGYHIKEFEHKTSVTITDILGQMQNAVFNDLANSSVTAPLVVMEESPTETVGCFFGLLLTVTSNKYSVMVCLISPGHQKAERPKKIFKMTRANETHGAEIFNFEQPITCINDEAEDGSRNNDDVEQNTFDINSLQSHFKQFKCNNCVINIKRGN